MDSGPRSAGDPGMTRLWSFRDHRGVAWDPARPYRGAAGEAQRRRARQVGAQRPADFALPATITSIGYQGGQSVIHLATEIGLPLRALLSSDEVHGFARGQSVWASWAPEDAVALTE